jgi:hypothetical protein
MPIHSGEPPPRPEVSAPSKPRAAPIQVGVTTPVRLLDDVAEMNADAELDAVDIERDAASQLTRMVKSGLNLQK